MDIECVELDTMNNPKILFAEDDTEDQFIITGAFREIGFAEDISFVENGEEVLHYLMRIGT